MESLDVNAASPNMLAVSSLPVRFWEEMNSKELLPTSCVKQPTILLVDDDPEVLCMTRAFLEMEGYRVFSCSDPRNAANIFGRLGRVDLLVTDYQMPGLSGLELARKLTSIQLALPVLVVSGSIFTPAMESEMMERQWYFIPKPWFVPKLLSTVDSMLKIVGEPQNSQALANLTSSAGRSASSAPAEFLSADAISAS